MATCKLMPNGAGHESRNTLRSTVIVALSEPRPMRSGISVIEVLTSIIVATIGVMGVLIMIPFAVNQVEYGFDQETSTNLARNASAEFEAKLFNNTNRWTRYRKRTPPVVVETDPTNPRRNVGNSTVRGYVIDPIADADRVVNNQASGYFPYVDENLENAILVLAAASYSDGTNPSTYPSADKCILLERATLWTIQDPNSPLPPTTLTPALARWHFNWQSDLQFREPAPSDTVASSYPTPELAPPQQVYDVDDSYAAMRRQFVGEMSYVVVSLPNDVVPNPTTYPTDLDGDPDTLTTIDPSFGDQVFEFRDYFLIYRTRPVPAAGSLAFDRVYQVQHPYPTYDRTITPYARISHSGGTLLLAEDAALAASNSQSTQRAEIRRGDWIALTNVIYNRFRSRFFQQINFYTVVDATLESNGWLVTLQGPDFDFGVSETFSGGWQTDTSQNYASFPDYRAMYDGTTNRPSKTYAIHLPDVWTVFERTYR